jgi:tetratricopeptide (TPR) repeat protein
LEAKEALANVCAVTAWKMCVSPDETAEDYAKALELAKRGVGLVPSWQLNSLAMAYLRNRDLDSFWEVEAEISKNQDARPVLFGTAIAAHLAGDHQLAEAHFLVSCDTFAQMRWWLYDVLREGIERRGKEACTLLGKPDLELSTERSPQEYVEAYTTIINRMPTCSYLHGRAVQHARLGEWNAAKDDLVRATENAPDDIKSWHRLGAWSLLCEDKGQFAKVRNHLSQQCRSADVGDSLPSIVTLLALSPDSADETSELAEMVKQCQSKYPGRVSDRAAGMVAFRQGNWQQARQLLGTGEDIASRTFRAMIDHRLGHLENAQEGLIQAAARGRAAPGETYGNGIIDLGVYSIQIVALRQAQKLIRCEMDPVAARESLAKAWSHYHRGETDASWEHLKKAFPVVGENPDTWLLAARLRCETSDTRDAALWYIAAKEWLLLQDPSHTGSKSVAKKVRALASCIHVADNTAIRNVAMQRIDDYSKLISFCPNSSWFHYLRGLHYGRLKEWDEACQDFAASVSLAPENIDFWSAWAVSTLHVGQTKEYMGICQSALERFAQHPNSYVRAKLVRFSSLAPLESAHRSKLVAIAREAGSQNDNDAVKTAYGMALYRDGEFQQALDWLPANNDPANAVPLAFRAMASKELGYPWQASESLQRAREVRQRHMPTPEGRELAWYFRGRPVAWCENEIAIQQAESLIESTSE